MSKASKLYQSLLANPNQIIAFRELERMLRATGFALKRRKGSHSSYRHPAVPRIFTIQPNGKDAEPYQVRAFVDMVQEYDLEFDS